MHNELELGPCCMKRSIFFFLIVSNGHLSFVSVIVNYLNEMKLVLHNELELNPCCREGSIFFIIIVVNDCSVAFFLNACHLRKRECVKSGS